MLLISKRSANLSIAHLSIIFKKLLLIDFIIIINLIYLVDEEYNNLKSAFMVKLFNLVWLLFKFFYNTANTTLHIYKL